MNTGLSIKPHYNVAPTHNMMTCHQADEGGKAVTMNLQILAYLQDATLEQPFRVISNWAENGQELPYES